MFPGARPSIPRASSWLHAIFDPKILSSFSRPPIGQHALLPSPHLSPIPLNYPLTNSPLRPIRSLNSIRHTLPRVLFNRPSLFSLSLSNTLRFYNVPSNILSLSSQLTPAVTFANLFFNTSRFSI